MKTPKKDLKKRFEQVEALLALHCTHEQRAKMLGISVGTFKSHLRQLRRKSLRVERNVFPSERRKKQRFGFSLPACYWLMEPDVGGGKAIACDMSTEGLMLKLAEEIQIDVMTHIKVSVDWPAPITDTNLQLMVTGLIAWSRAGYVGIKVDRTEFRTQSRL